MTIEWVIGNQHNSLYFVTKDKRCRVLLSFSKEGTSWFLLMDELGRIFDSPQHLWNKEIQTVPTS